MEERWITQASHDTFTWNDGQRMIDLSGGFGHQVPEVVQPVVQQLHAVGLSSRVLISAPLIALCERLSEWLGQGYENSYVCNSGDEAFEGALKLARALHPTRKTLLMVAGNDYGDMSHGALSRAGEGQGNLLTYLGVRVHRVERVEQLLGFERWDDCFALCYGPFVTVDSVRQWIPSALIDVLEAGAKRHGIPTLYSDIDTCLGSLGHRLSFQHCGAQPDIVVMGNSLGGGCVPIGTYSTSHALAASIYGKSSPAKHGSTTAGNPPACIAALSALQTATRQALWMRMDPYGQQLVAALGHPEARQFGGWVSLRLDDVGQAQAFAARLAEQGLHIRTPYSAEVLLRCPLTARSDVIAEAAHILKRILVDVRQQAA